MATTRSNFTTPIPLLRPSRTSHSKVSASLGEPVYGVPAEDEVPLDLDADEVARPELESDSRVDAPASPVAQVVQDPLTQAPCESGPCTRYCWPELYGDTDPDAEPYAVQEVIETPQFRLGIDCRRRTYVGRSCIGRSWTASPADFVRRELEPSSDFAEASSGSAVGECSDEPIAPEVSRFWPSGRGRFKTLDRPARLAGPESGDDQHTGPVLRARTDPSSSPRLSHQSSMVQRRSGGPGAAVLVRSVERLP